MNEKRWRFAAIMGFLFCFTIHGRLTVMAEDTYITRESAVEKVMTCLFTSENPDFHIDRYYCIHGNRYLHFVPDEDLEITGYPVLCKIYNEAQGLPFQDVAENIYLMLAYEMGIINGYSPESFQPQQDITYLESILLMARGWRVPGATYMDADPGQYIQQFTDKGLLENITYNPDGKITEQDFDILLDRFSAYSQGLGSHGFVDFHNPQTPEECARFYAEAVQQRNGYMQYALLSKELQELMRNDFELWYWITGTSSPWVERFEIEAVSCLQYTITQYFATSTGSAGSGQYTVQVSDVNGYYCISGLVPENGLSH